MRTQPKTTLYRAVNPAELADIKETGKLINRGSAMGKYFSTSAEGAVSYAKQAVNAFKDEPYTMISTKISSQAITALMKASVDRGISSVVIPNELLSELEPVIHNSMPVP